MNILNKYFNKKNYLIISLIILLTFVIIFILLNTNIKKSISAILEVDSKKNMALKFSSSNINIISSQKDLSINLEGNIYFIENIELTYLGNNLYRIDFENDELYKLIKTNSIYEVNIFIDNKKIFDFIFNI